MEFLNKVYKAKSLTLGGFMHVYPLLMAGLTYKNALYMFSFFFIQAFLTFFEVAFIPRKMDLTAKRVWTLSAAIVPAFLFAEPMYQLAGIEL